MHANCLLHVLLVWFFVECRGTCPEIDPEMNFDMERVLGHWFIVQRTGASHHCLTLNFTRRSEKGEYRMIETCQSGKIVNALGLQHEHHVKGKLFVPDPAAPAIMDLNLPLRLRTFKLTVFATDYEHYLGYVTCKKGFAFTNSPEVTIASRTPNLEPRHLEPVYTKLLKYNINPYVIDTVKQYECAQHGDKGIFVKAANGVVGTVKHALGSIADVFSPKKKKDEAKVEVTTDYEIDVRKGSFSG